MRSILIITYLVSSLSLFGQNLTLFSNTCDSTILSKPDYRKCIGDTIYNNDIIARTNYITFIKTELLPKYRLKRNSLQLPENLKRQVKLLKAVYDSTLNHKIQVMTAGMDRNQKYVQPKAYIVSLLALETFKFYPDLYAILLNPIHVSLKPESDYEKMKQVENLVDNILASTPPGIKETIQQLSLTLTKERTAFTKDSFYDIFQGEIDEEKRMRYNIVNFLLWTE